MSAHKLSDGRVRVSVTYLVPSGVSLRLTADEFVVIEPGDGLTQRSHIGRLTHYTAEGRWAEVGIQSEVSGRDLGPPDRRSPAPFFGAFTTEAPLPSVFEVQLPPAVVNGAATGFPRVLFQTIRSRTTRSTGRADKRRAGEPER